MTLPNYNPSSTQSIPLISLRVSAAGMSFNTMFSDSGVFGFYLSATPNHGSRLLQVAANEVRRASGFTALIVSPGIR